MDLTKIILECLLFQESLDVEKQTYEDPSEEFYIDVDPRDPDTGVISYLGYEFPIVKELKQGGVSYFIGSVGRGLTVRGNKAGAFTQVIDAIKNGKVNPSKAQAKNQPEVPRNIPKTVEIETPLGVKTYNYIPQGEVDDFVTRMYEKWGAKYKEVLKDYATDRPSGSPHLNPYIPINQTARQNVYLHKGGTKAKAMNYRTF